MSLKTLAISNPSIDMKGIQKTISRLNTTSANNMNIITNKVGTSYPSGLLLYETGYLNSFKDCTEI